MAQLAKLRDGRLSDVKIITDSGREHLAHRAVLGACSDVFMAMFETPMMESKTGVIKVPDYSDDVVDKFLQFVYDGKCDTGDVEILIQLMMFAETYMITGLENYVIKKFQTEKFSLADSIKIANIDSTVGRIGQLRRFHLQKMASAIIVFVEAHRTLACYDRIPFKYGRSADHKVELCCEHTSEKELKLLSPTTDTRAVVNGKPACSHTYQIRGHTLPIINNPDEYNREYCCAHRDKPHEIHQQARAKLIDENSELLTAIKMASKTTMTVLSEFLGFPLEHVIKNL